MALPTFDFANIARIIFSKVLLNIKSPLTLALGFAVTLSTVGSVLYNQFTDWTIPQIQLGNIDISFISLSDWILYMSNISFGIKIVNVMINFMNYLIPFSITFFTSFFAAIWLYGITSAARNTAKQNMP